jgi:hypothetical protein
MQNLLPEVGRLTVSGKSNSSQKLSVEDQESARAAVRARGFFVFTWNEMAVLL